MEKSFIIFYESEKYGYQTTTIDALTIKGALEYFVEFYDYKTIHGIMLT